MHYPWWYVPQMTSPMLIAAIAVFHVIISHYAVGGGLFLAFETSYAYKTKDKEYLAYLYKHAKFFVLLTVVLGAVTGVGIWWTIGLASPLATEMLIRTFVFGWGIEWVFFVIELASAFIFVYYWGRLPQNTHIAMGWIYAVAAWISLVLITAITAFMLNSRGLFGDWSQTGDFWHAMFNVQFLPQTVYRTGAALMLGSLYVYLHASFTLADDQRRKMLQKRSARPAMLGAVLLATGILGWYASLSESSALVLEAAAALNVFVGVTVAASLLTAALIWIGPLLNPRWLSPGFALAMFAIGIGAFSGAEFIREAVRKPFIVDGVILGNQISVDEVIPMRQTGYLESGEWTRPYVLAEFPSVAGPDGTIDETKFAGLANEERIELGRVLFQYHCNDCHAGAHGYSAAGPLLTGRTQESTRDLISHLHEAHFVMPPWCGTPEEADVLADYLTTIRPESPCRIPGIEQQTMSE